MAILEQIKVDLQGAMRAGEKERVGALRMVLSELQKAAKEGGDDASSPEAELAVLRRERKRRLEAAAAYRDAGHQERAAGEQSEAALIGTYLPAELLPGGARGDRHPRGERQRRGVGQGHGHRDEAGDGGGRRPR